MNGSSRVTLLCDGDAPLCSREIRFVERRDRERGRVRFEDISAPSFDPGGYGPDARKVRLRLLVLAMLATTLACRASNAPLEVANEVELDRYLGRWYEIASFPQRFQQGCVATTATYTTRDDGRIRVENECRDGSFEGDVRRVEGVAWITDPDETRAKLKVQFFWPFRGDYWIIELDPEYRYAVVGHPSRDYLWILARTRTLDPAVYETLRARIEAQGYDLERLSRTPQPPAP